MSLRLADVTRDNFWDVLNLKSSKDQEERIQIFERWVGSNVFFIALGSVHGFKNKAIYDGDTLIGFASHGWDHDHDRWEMISMMLGHAFQGKGYGKKALQLVLDDMIEEYDCSEIYLSVIHDNEAAIRVYEALGFEATGEVFKAFHDEPVYKFTVKK
ncbi:GNAT family N-acetyltransferase [Rossellomorea vietnamensis]|uniref:GNAT family N-acetyltransferase n=1 Tax=Rossellomorea vietnamensis TaxID=218284 RepID=A0A5D4NL22_9BACI|nr:GNAT family N-acetyltransferase [Rossellomorea vietnamensis]TYS14066.1 GNAT family N-acetyltransferase [Rossellomorea vietnamensis]